MIMKSQILWIALIILAITVLSYFTINIQNKLHLIDLKVIALSDTSTSGATNTLPSNFPTPVEFLDEYFAEIVQLGGHAFWDLTYTSARIVQNSWLPFYVSWDWYISYYSNRPGDYIVSCMDGFQISSCIYNWQEQNLNSPEPSCYVSLEKWEYVHTRIRCIPID